MAEALPAIEALVKRAPHNTVFTRFIPPLEAGDEIGTWRECYTRWPSMVRSRLAPGMLQVVPTLARHVPPGRARRRRS